MLAKGRIKEKGVIPPERIGMDEKTTRALLSELKNRGVVVEESEI
jgi:saccharopine dehydrogenase-like NADP-dependent oxidoreductase